MSAANTQIVTLYEQEGMKVEEIAAELNYDPLAVKAVLAGASRAYQQAAMQQDLTEDEDITDSEFKQLRQRMVQIALNSDDEHIVTRLGTFLWNEKKGRNNVVGIAGGVQKLNITLINQTLQAANGAVQRALKTVGPQKQIQRELVEEAA